MTAENNVKISSHKVLHIIFGIIFPILPLNLVSLSLTQNNINKIYQAQMALEETTDNKKTAEDLKETNLFEVSETPNE